MLTAVRAGGFLDVQQTALAAVQCNPSFLAE
jgi:hypothetical protein